jgi:hypothetical protein
MRTPVPVGAGADPSDHPSWPGGSVLATVDEHPADETADERRRRLARARAKRHRDRKAAAERAAKRTPTRSEQGLPSPTHDAAAEHAAGFRWESFQESNWIGVTHGSRSPRLVGRLAAEIAAWARETFPDLQGERYRLELADWAWSEATVGLLRLFLDAQDPIAEDGTPRDGILNSTRVASRRAGELRARLGMTPADHARLETARREALGRISPAEWRERGAAALRARGYEVAEYGKPELVEAEVVS